MVQWHPYSGTPCHNGKFPFEEFRTYHFAQSFTTVDEGYYKYSYHRESKLSKY